MKEHKYIKNMVFASVMAFACLFRLVMKVFFPDIMFPHISIPYMVLLVAISEIISFYLHLDDDGNFFLSSLLGGLTLFAFPLVTGIVANKSIVGLLFSSIVVYAAVSYIYEFAAKRMKSGNITILAPVVNGLMLFLASQAFQSLFI